MIVPLSHIFRIEYPKTMIFSEQQGDELGYPFVSSSGENNGWAGKIKANPKNKLYKGCAITVPLKGSVLDAFYQPFDFYVAHQIAVLYPKKEMSLNEMMYYVVCIRRNKYKFNYGRQADTTLRDIQVPLEMPEKLKHFNIPVVNNRPFLQEQKNLGNKEWKWFKYNDIFDLSSEPFISIEDAEKFPGDFPFISTSGENNGVACYTSIETAKTYPAGCLTVASSGNAGEVFYQDMPFKVTNMVIILKPKFKINKYIGLFLKTLIYKEKYRYSYGRKSGIERMKESRIKLPVTPSGAPDWQFMEEYIQSLPYSASI